MPLDTSGKEKLSVNNFVNTLSRGTCFTKPLTTVLGLASPTSTCSTYRVSASGCFSAVIMQPTRRSRRETSTGFALLLPAAGCCFSFFSPIREHFAHEISILKSTTNVYDYCKGKARYSLRNKHKFCAKHKRRVKS